MEVGTLTLTTEYVHTYDLNLNLQLAICRHSELNKIGNINMGLMEELPLERIWRDARIERIWDGTSEIQRHIISRGLLRPLGA